MQKIGLLACIQSLSACLFASSIGEMQSAFGKSHNKRPVPRGEARCLGKQAFCGELKGGAQDHQSGSGGLGPWLC
jgi:hypothetical protein